MFAAQKSDIEAWLSAGVERGAAHLIVAVDGWDHEDYPVYVMPEQDVREVKEEYDGKDMQRVIEVYDLAMDHVQQLGQRRAMNM